VCLADFPDTPYNTPNRQTVDAIALIHRIHCTRLRVKIAWHTSPQLSDLHALLSLSMGYIVIALPKDLNQCREVIAENNIFSGLFPAIIDSIHRCTHESFWAETIAHSLTTPYHQQAFLAHWANTLIDHICKKNDCAAATIQLHISSPNAESISARLKSLLAIDAPAHAQQQPYETEKVHRQFNAAICLLRDIPQETFSPFKAILANRLLSCPHHHSVINSATLPHLESIITLFERCPYRIDALSLEFKASHFQTSCTTAHWTPKELLSMWNNYAIDAAKQSAFQTYTSYSDFQKVPSTATKIDLRIASKDYADQFEGQLIFRSIRCIRWNHPECTFLLREQNAIVIMPTTDALAPTSKMGSLYPNKARFFLYSLAHTSNRLLAHAQSSETTYASSPAFW